MPRAQNLPTLSRLRLPDYLAAAAFVLHHCSPQASSLASSVAVPVAKMGSLARGVLVRQAFSKCGRRQHKKLLEKYGYGCLSSCVRLDQLNTQAPFDEKTVTDMMHNRDPQPRLRLTEETARSLAKNFTSEDRQLLLKEIQQIKGDEAIREFSGK